MINSTKSLRSQLAPYFPLGTVLYIAHQTPPDGWLECDGRAVSRTDFADLFALVGTTFGSGDGSTTFNIPDFRGEFLRGWSHGKSGVDDGRTFGSSQAEELKAHTHTVTVLGGSGASGSTSFTMASTDKTRPMTPTSSSTGGAETRPRNFALMPIIKAINVLGYAPIVQGSNADTLDNLHASAFCLADATILKDTGHSFAQNGWQQLNNGFIIQWGRITDNASVYIHSFPIAFPTACFSINVTWNPTSYATCSTGAGAIIIDNATFEAWQYTLASGNPVSWIAIGH
jgi:microcystin-dependent protein